jgi:hypothetical protein
VIAVTMEKQASPNSLYEAVNALVMKFDFLVGTSLVRNIFVSIESAAQN